MLAFFNVENDLKALTTLLIFVLLIYPSINYPSKQRVGWNSGWFQVMGRLHQFATYRIHH